MRRPAGSELPHGTAATSVAPERVGPTLRFLAHQRSFVIVLIGFCLPSFTNYATSIWIPLFLARVHHLSSADIGFYAGTFKGLCGMAGTLTWGLVVTRISARDDRWKLWAPPVKSALVLCNLIFAFYAPDLRIGRQWREPDVRCPAEASAFVGWEGFEPTSVPGQQLESENR